MRVLNGYHIYNYQFLTHEATVKLPSFAINNNKYLSHGRFVFLRSDGSRYFVVMQDDPAAGLLYDFAVTWF